MKHFLIIFIFYPFILFAQNNTSLYFGIEPQIGKIAPNTSSHPKTSANLGLHLQVGFLQLGNNGWGEFYNYPELGLDLGYNFLGEKDIFGSEFSLNPYFILPTSKDPKKGASFKLGFGLSTFNKKYHEVNNPRNLYTGSTFAFTFNVGVFKSFPVSEKLRIKTGLALRHSSNGHTQLPNYGINSALASIIFQFFPKTIGERNTFKKPFKKEYCPYLILNQGIGTHELGGPISPIGGKDGFVSTTGLTIGILFKKHILVRTGFSYRYYQLYQDYIEENSLVEYNKNTIWSSSNLIFTIGTEFLMGHFSIDIQGGLNLTKPFYKTHYEVFENTKEFDRITKRWLTTKFGFNAYLFNTKNLPQHNIRLGVFINANFGQADFAELGLAYVFKLNHKLDKVK